VGLLIRNLLYILPVVQCLCAIHVYRTGRPNYWFYVILIFPGIGSMAYIITEILPGVRWDRFELEIPFFKQRRLARLADQAEFAPTVQNRCALADEHARQGNFDEAIALYEDCLRGTMKDDVHLLFALADHQESACQWEGVMKTLARLRPDDLRRQENRAARFQAVALNGLQRYSEAEPLYRHLLEGWPGEEVRCRLALLLLHLDRTEEAMKLLDEIKRNSKRGSSHYRVVNRYWIRWALHLLKSQEKAAKAG
jgi:hypothetical protein